jgi:hypothetical protein
MIDLKQLFTFEHPERTLIDTLVQAETFARCANLPDEYSASMWGFLTEEDTGWSPVLGDRGQAVATFMKGIIPKVPLVDLGCGGVFVYPGNKTMIYAAQQLGLPAYIGVDRYNVGTEDPWLDPTVNVLTERQKDSLKIYGVTIDTALVRADMLDFASRMEPGVFNVTVNGIDHHILRQPERYSAALAKELGRVCLPGSMVLGNASEVFYSLCNSNEFRRVEVPNERTMNPPMNVGWIFERST